MKRILVVCLAVAALAACSKKPGATAHLPEMYFTKDQTYCLAEATTSEPDALVRRTDMKGVLTSLYRASQGWRERYTVVGVDYVDFKKLTFIIQGACGDKKAVDTAKADLAAASKKFTLTIGGDKALVGDAELLNKTPSIMVRFAALNPDEKAEDCLLHWKLPRNGEDVQGKIPSAIDSAANVYHFPLADRAMSGDNYYMLLARNCADKDKMADNFAVFLQQQGLTEREVVRVKDDSGIADYISVRGTAEQPKG